MQLEVISDDRPLLALCREIARESPSVTWRFATRADYLGATDPDLCLWDYESGSSMPESGRWGSQCFVLVRPSELAAFRAEHSYAEAGIVLKPVTRAVLRALVAQTTARSHIRTRANQELLRSDRDDILQFLMQTNLQLQQYDAERTNFLGRALHDFHAPLSALSGYCGLLLEEKSGLLNEEQALILNRMLRSVRRLSRMSKAMFQLSVGRHVAMKPVLSAGDLRDCAEQTLYEIQQSADEKELQLDIDFEPLETPLLIDSGQIEQVMINLLENACKFSPRGGVIVVKGYSCFCERRAQNVFNLLQADQRSCEMRAPNVYRVDIRDSGPGVSSEHTDSIFEEYVSYAGGQDRSRGGLGLAICRMILHQHQGRIWAENSDSGAVFSFILPLRHAAVGRDPAEIAGIGARRESGAACA